MPNLSASFQYKLSARCWTVSWLTVTVIVVWLSVVVAWLAKVTIRLCRSALVVKAWRWAMRLTSVVMVVTTWWRTLTAYLLVWVCRVCRVCMAIARRHIKNYVHLAWATRICAINIVCHCTADCHC